MTALVLGLVVLAGGLCLTLPFWGDQALFTVYGRELTRGAVLYRDVFDVKQPGIFVFYAVAGSLFGFTEVGIHLFELIYWLGFSIFALRALPPYFTTRWGAPLVPVLTVVVYYLYAGLLDLTQIEILVAFPILLAWWLIDRADPGARSGPRRYAAAGLAAASVVLLKHLYVLIVLAFVVYAVLRARRHGTPTRDLRRCVLAFSIVLIVPLLAVTAYFAAYGQLGRIWWAYFELGPAAQGSERDVSELALGVRRFLIGHGPILILAALGCVDALRERVRPRADLVIVMVLWGVFGAAAFFIQTWFEYKLVLFTVPLGILAAVGVEAAITLARTARKHAVPGFAAGGTGAVAFLVGGSDKAQTALLSSIVAGVSAGIAVEVLGARPSVRRVSMDLLVVALVVSLGLATIAPADKVRVLVTHDLGLSVEARAELRRSWSPFYRAIDHDLRVIGTALPPGPMEVFGDPVLLLRANRSPAVSFLGLRPEFYDDRAWRQLMSDLRSGLPPSIIVDRYIGSVIRDLHPAVSAFIESRYDVVLTGTSGRWYLRRDLTSAAL